MKNNIPDCYIEIKETKEIHSLLYKILNEFHQVCEKNNLYYCLFGGTLLGAVRHSGIIPWDDDVDVVMPRCDFDKFVSLNFNSGFCCLYKQAGYRYPFAKFCLEKTILIEKNAKRFPLKCYIDVFPADGYPKINEDKFFKKLDSFKKRRYRSSSDLSFPVNKIKKIFSPLLIIKHAFYRLFSVEKICTKTNELLKKNSIENCDFILMDGAGTWHKKGKISKDDFFERKLTAFGKYNFYIFKNYHSILSNYYGEYLKLPPLNNRVSVHNYSLYIDSSLL